MAQALRSGWGLEYFRRKRISPRPYEDVPSGGHSNSLRIPMDEPVSSRMASRAVSYVEVEIQAKNPSISYTRLLALLSVAILIVTLRIMDAVDSLSRADDDTEQLLIKISVILQAALFMISAMILGISSQLAHPHDTKYLLVSVSIALIGILVCSQISNNESTERWCIYSTLSILSLVSSSIRIRFHHCLVLTICDNIIYIILLIINDKAWQDRFASALVLVVLSFMFCHSSFQNEMFRKAEVSYIRKIQKENRQLQERLRNDSTINTPLDRVMSKLNLVKDASDEDVASDLEEVIRLLSAHAESLLRPALPAAADQSALKYLEFTADPASKMKRQPTKMSSTNLLTPAITDRSESDKHRVDINLSEWNVDYLDIDANSEGRGIFFLAETIFHRHNLLDELKIDHAAFRSFFRTLQRRYHSDVIYHNSAHGADVCHSFYYILSKSDLIRYLQPVEIFAAVIACLGHDVNHPGYNNSYMINTRSPEAMLYNDRTVLENMHAAEIFRIASSEQANIFGSLTRDQYNSARAIIIDMILATDLAKHFEILSAFKAKLSASDVEKRLSESDIMTKLQIVIKIADLGHFAKEKSLHNRWNDRVLEEFYKQGDEEIARGFDVSPLMDRRLRQTMLSQNQVGFINYIVRPLFVAGLEVFPTMQPIIAEMEANFAYWKAYKPEDNMTENDRSEYSSTVISSPRTR